MFIQSFSDTTLISRNNFDNILLKTTNYSLSLHLQYSVTFLINLVLTFKTVILIKTYPKFPNMEMVS